MTTIAYSNGVLAADTLVTERGARLATKTKIVRRKGMLAGGAGSSVICRAFTDWFLDGMRGAPPNMQPDKQRPSSECVIFYAPKKFITFDGDGVSDLEADYFALGSGASFAKGAMAMGADPVRAVEIAMQFDLYSGGPIVRLEL